MNSGLIPAGAASRRLLLSLFAIALPLVLLGYRGVIDSGDGMHRYAGARALLRGGGYAVAGADGIVRPLKYGPAHSVLALPLLVGARLAAPALLRATTLAPRPEWRAEIHEYVTRGGFMLLMPLVTLATTLLLADTLLLLGASAVRAWWLALLWLAGTPALVYANLAFDEPLQALLLLAGAHAALRGRGAIAALWFGLAPFTRLSALIFLPMGFILLERSLLELTPARRRFIAATAGMLALQLWYLRGHFGVWFSTGYGGEGFVTPLPAGLAGLLLAPGKSIFIFAPILLAAVVFLPRGWRARREVAAAAGYGLTAFLVVFAQWWDWSGDTCWGPRFLMAILPLLLLPLATVRLPARLLMLLGILGLLINLPALLVPYQDLWQQVMRDSDGDGAVALLAWRYDPVAVFQATTAMLAQGAAADTVLLAGYWWKIMPGLPLLLTLLALSAACGLLRRPRINSQ